MFTCGSLLIMCDQWFPSCDRLTAIAVAVVSADDILSSAVEAGKRCARGVDFVSSPESGYLKGKDGARKSISEVRLLMSHYVLHSWDQRSAAREEIAFDSVSIAGALDKAKNIASGTKADLYENGRPVCSMELVGKTGVWLIGKPNESTED